MLGELGAVTNSVDVHEILSRKKMTQDGCRFESNSLLVGPGPVEGVPSVGVFLRDPSPYLRKFWRRPQKTPKGLGRQT